ncbi:phenylacetate-CoA oxygenase [Bacillaceae bacterium JMAK1]|nr:phenylacetate-CoA oxygenase [Bacillaceae bacterium JMAK1]
MDKRNEALLDLLYQCADDDLLVSFRGSEWLGLAPHVEADVAFSSITQNTMGHAVYFYRLLQELGEGDVDVLAHERPALKRRNAIYLEKRNGDGQYDEDPYFDWALAVVRGYFYETYKRVKLISLTASSYEPLAICAKRILPEQRYHLAYWKEWMKQLQQSSPIAREKIRTRIEEAWSQSLDLFDFGQYEQTLLNEGYITDPLELKQQWLAELQSTVKDLPSRPLEQLKNGRNGEHTTDLDVALATLSEVYQTDPVAQW